MVSVVDLAWLVGLIEGDGSVSLKDGKYIMIQIANADLALLQEVRKLVGGHIYEKKLSKSALGKKPTYSWQKVGHKAKILAEALLPLLKGSKKQAYFELLGKPLYQPLEGSRT